MSFPNIPNITPAIGSGGATCEGNSTNLYFPNTQTENGYTITFVSFDPATKTYCYSVDFFGTPQGLSHFTIGVDCPIDVLDTIENDDLVCTRSDGGPVDCEVVITPDEGEVPGFKFDNIALEPEEDTFPITFCVTVNTDQPLYLGCVLASGKTAQDSDTGDNTIPGPSCTPANPLTTEQIIPVLLSSIALEELALAHIMNAEAEKLQFVLGTLGDTGVTLELPEELTVEDLLDVNDSVRRTLRDVIKKEMLLQFKFDNILDLF